VSVVHNFRLECLEGASQWNAALIFCRSIRFSLLYSIYINSGVHLARVVSRWVWGTGQRNFCRMFIRLVQGEIKPVTCKCNITGIKLYMYGIGCSFFWSGVIVKLIYFNTLVL
jgi:hypothetical protein